MGFGLQETAGELAAEQPRTTDEERRGGVGPPRIVRPEILDRRAVHRQLIEAERGNVEDVIEVTGVAHAQVDEQVVDHHPQQHAINDAEYIQAHRLVFEIRGARPQRHRGLDRAFAGQSQVHGLLLIRLECKVEQIVVLANLAAGERQGITGLADEAIVATGVGQIQVEMIERRIRQLQQPGALGGGIARAVMQVDLQPERRARVTGIERGFIVGFEIAGSCLRANIGNARLTARVFEHLQRSAQREALGEFVEFDGARHEGQAEQQHQQIAH